MALILKAVSHPGEQTQRRFVAQTLVDFGAETRFAEAMWQC
jgi:hypothetical protein